MGCRWNPIRFQFFWFLFLIISLQIRSSSSLNSEGFALLKFRARVDSDPHGTFENWNCNDLNPCLWSGICCVNGKVQLLDLRGRSLGGTLAPELSQLTELRSLILHKNHFSGNIPKEFGAFIKLEILDIRNNNFSGEVPSELNKVLSLKRLLISDNKFEEKIPTELKRLASLSEFQLQDSSVTRFGCANRKFGFCIWRSSFGQLNKAKALVLLVKGTVTRYVNAFPLTMFKINRELIFDHVQNSNAYFPGFSEKNEEKIENFMRRHLLEESMNLPAAPSSNNNHSIDIIPEASMHSSGSFPAIPNAKKKNQPALPLAPSPSESGNVPNLEGQTFQKPLEPKKKSSKNIWLYVIVGVASTTVLTILAAMVIMCRKRAAKTIGPWKTGLSGQLQKAFITGVPKLNRSELETACEDFSNIIETFDGYTVYKGTLSSGVEIAVASTAISSANEWTRSMEMAYRRKIDTLSRINHKNFVNLIGYCEEDEPFNRMMVFEYAPNGTLFEHLHVEEMEHLDWNSRMRIIMGTAYCLQYMHELNPPVAHSDFSSSAICLTDDYAAKVVEIFFNSETGLKPKPTSSGELEHSALPILPEPETNVFSFGVLLLEIISGKLPYSDEEGCIENWASKYLNDKTILEEMIDPTLKSFKHDELEVICEVIEECLKAYPRQRPTMKELATKLKDVIHISPDQATPRLSPLWWAELEILSSEAT